jgi:3-hydroxyisobutyrate dehydrogenase-like beta-hydroxyacid dehydrogenase
MARHLVSAGCVVHVFDLNAERLAAVVSAGATPSPDAPSVVRSAEVVFASLPTHEALVAVAEQTLLPSARAGQVFVDLGTTIPHETRRLAAQFAARGATLLDVPVSGGSEGAEKGRLRMFAGGDEAWFGRVRPLLEIMGGPDKLTYCGPSGCGQIAKGVNQLKSALGTAAMVEALAFAVRAGVPAETVAAAFGAGSKEEASGIVKYARAVAANPAAHFGVKFRELPYFLAEARAGGFALPLTEALHAFCERGERVVTDDNRPAPSFWHQLMQR